MSGLLALLDDVAAIAKVAAASVDDIAAQAAKAGSKTAGILIDDAAVTPKYVTGLAPARELPIIWRIAKGSFFNKLIILLPVAMLLSYFAPWLITPILMIGGCYLCFEGAEKVYHWLAPHPEAAIEEDMSPKDPAHLEEERVQGAIKTDFILSAEIMAITLATIPESNIWMEGAVLAVVAIGITIAVYGTVAVIVKMDDVGLRMAQSGRLGLTRSAGRGLVAGMPGFLRLLTIIGTAAMLWVGGSIIIHGLETTHWWAWPYEAIHAVAVRAAEAVGAAQGFVEWAVTAAFDGVIGLAIGIALIPVVLKVINPAIAAVTGKAPTAH